MRQVFLVRELLFAAGGAFLLFLLAVEGRLARQIAQPLESIVSRMNSIRELKDIGNGFVITGRDGPREITEVSETFADLLSRIEALNSRIAEESSVKRQAELRALQMQINPHFIYNSLDSIRWLTLAGRKDETATMIDGLSRFFRLGLSGGKEMVAISHEIEHVESFLAVQKIRFAERLGYMIDVEPAVLGLSIPKIVLHPLVENSLSHGMRGRTSIFVTVQGKLEGSAIHLEVIDDGCGMNERAVRELHERLASTPAGGSHSGDGYGLRFTSREGVGTKVMLRIPADPGPGA